MQCTHVGNLGNTYPGTLHRTRYALRALLGSTVPVKCTCATKVEPSLGNNEERLEARKRTVGQFGIPAQFLSKIASSWLGAPCLRRALKLVGGVGSGSRLQGPLNPRPRESFES